MKTLRARVVAFPDLFFSTFFRVPLISVMRRNGAAGWGARRARTTSRRQTAPPGIASMGSEVWRGDRAPEERGIVVLGTPVGAPEFLRAHATSRLAREERFLQWLPKMRDLQCVW